MQSGLPESVMKNFIMVTQDITQFTVMLFKGFVNWCSQVINMTDATISTNNP